MKTKGLFFTIEALATLLAATSLLILFSGTGYSPRYVDIYSYELVQDVAELSFRNHESDLALLSLGVSDGYASLRNPLNSFAESTGTYCMEIDANEHRVRSACDSSKESEQFSTTRTIWNGVEWVRVRFYVTR
ncbi:hypothetical protein KJ765_04420 [Candidatus Micrarchaeota archaeon]|nr:hypothetical protein [Candidatus Micrarchaeota archaeon]